MNTSAGHQARNLGHASDTHGRRGLRAAVADGRRGMAALVGLALLLTATPAFAGTIRLLPLAVVTSDGVTLGDIADLTGFSTADAKALSVVSIASIPTPGGTTAVDMSSLRSALYKSGANLADIRLCGVASCRITRPSDGAASAATVVAPRGGPSAPAASAISASSKAAQSGSPPGAKTLRCLLEENAQESLAHHGGRAVVVFERDADPLLDLVSPPLKFSISRRGGADLGPTTYTVDIRQGDALLQTVTIRADVSLAKGAVVARRPILKDAIVSADDVEVRELVSRAGARAQVNEPSAVIGRQALRFHAPGEALDPQQFKTVPLIARDQTVRVVASSNGVRIETIGQAQASGSAGDVIRVRLVDREKDQEEVAATIVGPGMVIVGVVLEPARLGGAAAGR